MTRRQAEQAQQFLKAARHQGMDEAEARQWAEDHFDYRELDYHYPIAFRLRRFVQNITSSMLDRRSKA